MAYSKAKLEKQALAAIEKHNLVFTDEVVAYLPCSTATYYNHQLEKLETIKAALEKNRIQLKGGLRSKWYQSDNATAQIALYKLIGNDEESERLNGSKQKIEHSGETSQKIIVEFTDDGLE
jgi:hypothetical protein